MMMEPTAFERLSSDLWAQVLKRLTVPDLCAAGLACTAWRASYIDNRDAIWQAVLAAPRVEPYLQGRDVDDWGPVQRRYARAMATKRAWRTGRPAKQEMLVFPSYVRCMKVDWETRRVAVGMYDGRVLVNDMVLSGRDGGTQAGLHQRHLSLIHI